MTIRHICPLCEATCGLQLTVDGDQVIGVRGDADDVFSRGFVCPGWRSATSTTTRPTAHSDGPRW